MVSAFLTITLSIYLKFSSKIIFQFDQMKFENIDCSEMQKSGERLKFEKSRKTCVKLNETKK